MDTFPLLMVLALALAVGLALGALIGVLWARSRPGDDAAVAALEQRVADHAVVQDGLERLQDQLSDLAHDRVAWQAQLHQQVADMRLSTETLRRETTTLATALRKPQVRGRWGELHLRRTVELAGLVDHCDFAEQVRMDDGRLRPDLVVTLAGGRTIAVDAKAPLAAFLDLTGTDDPAEHDRALARLGEHMRTHVADLGSRRYWEALPGTPEFVVLFVPGEAILQAALQAVPDLVEQASAKNVVLATPSTLIALLRTVAQGWQHEVLNEQAQAVQRLGQELHARLGSMAGHLDKVGRSLNASVVAYNQAMGSLEGRVLVSARRFAELGVTSEPLDEPRQVETVPRSAAAPELAALDGVRSATQEPTIDDLLAQQARSRPRRAAPREREIGPRLRDVTSGRGVLGGRARARPPGGVPRRRGHADRGEHRRAARRAADPVLRPVLHGAVPGAGRAGPSARLLHGRPAATAADDGRVRLRRAGRPRGDRRPAATACCRPSSPGSPPTASPSASATHSAWAGSPGACTVRARPTSPPSSSRELAQPTG